MQKIAYRQSCQWRVRGHIDYQICTFLGIPATTLYATTCILKHLFFVYPRYSLFIQSWVPSLITLKKSCVYLKITHVFFFVSRTLLPPLFFPQIFLCNFEFLLIVIFLFSSFLFFFTSFFSRYSVYFFIQVKKNVVCRAELRYLAHKVNN
jgi:hypothetical protein